MKDKKGLYIGIGVVIAAIAVLIIIFFYIFNPFADNPATPESTSGTVAETTQPADNPQLTDENGD